MDEEEEVADCPDESEETPEDDIEGESLFDCVNDLKNREKIKLVSHPT